MMFSKQTTMKVLRTPVATFALAAIVATTLSVTSAIQTSDSAYTAVSNSKANVLVSVVPAYRMTCTTASIDYGVTAEGHVYYGSGDRHVNVSSNEPLVGKKIVQLVCNDALMAGLDSLGDVYTWEPDPKSITRVDLLFSDGERAVQLASTLSSISVLTSDGRVFSFGRNYSGEFGNGTVDDYSTIDPALPVSREPKQLQLQGNLAGAKLKAIAAGSNGLVGLTTAGVVIRWGADNNFGILLFPEIMNSTAEFTNKGIRSVGASRDAYFALFPDGTLFSWGRGADVGTSPEYPNTPSGPSMVNSHGTLANRPVTELFTAHDAPVFALTPDGQLHNWGMGARGAGDFDLFMPVYEPELTDMSGALEGKTITNVFPGQYTSSAQVAESQALYWWGYGWFINENNEDSPTFSIGSQQLLPQ